LIIADRTFSNIKDLANKKFYSNNTYSFFKLATLGWTAHNDLGFLKSSASRKKPYKVITVDKQDEVVPVFSSLTVGITKKVWTQLAKREDLEMPFKEKQI
jgi:hypothetical protein